MLITLRQLAQTSGILIGAFLCLATATTHAMAAAGFGDDFGLNFQPIGDLNGGRIQFACGYPGQPRRDCEEDMAAKGGNFKVHPGPPDDEQPYLVETWGTGNAGYWHQIIGDPAEGWVQEVYLRGPLNIGSTPGGVRAPSGGQNDARFQPLLSDSKITGNGTGNPTMVAIRMYMKDTDTTGTTIETDFIKDGFVIDSYGNKRFDRKPYIEQSITTQNELRSEFIVDMRNISYYDDSSDPQLFIMRQYNMDMVNPDNPIPEDESMNSLFAAVLTTEPISGLTALLFDPTIPAPPPPPGSTTPLPDGRNINLTAGKFRWTGDYDAAGSITDEYIYMALRRSV